MTNPALPPPVPRKKRSSRLISRAGNKFKRLRATKCFNDFRDRLLAGWSLEQLAEFIQEDKKELTDVLKATLISQIRSYRATIPPGDFISQTPPANMVQQRMLPVHNRMITAMRQGMDELVELEHLYQRQLERIEIDTRVEKEQKKLIPSMTQEIRIAKEILDSSAKLKMDLGLQKRHLGVMETEARLIQDVGQKYGDARVVEALKDSQSRQRLAGVVAAFERLMLTDGDKGDPLQASSLLDDLTGVLPEPVSHTEEAPEEEPEEELVSDDTEDVEDE